ncbi:unnamed protein product [Lactuca virosa]|uniref:pectinesterase n=2 Tax=Lactuca virosa TaxID=75947 RepID=A0AAU9N6Y4_9ASTR|nr:unnamed protein product [Lactuca virosa]
MANHLIQAVLSLGFSIVVILCIVALVARNGYLEDDELINTKAFCIICKPTEYKDACKKALSEVSKNSSSTKKDYIFASFHSIQKGLDKASEYAKSGGSELKNCEKLLGDASEALNQVLNVATKSKIVTLGEQADPMLVWLTAIRAYQTTCVDEINDENLRKEMKQELDDANKHTFNTQKIVYYISDILMEFGVDMGNFHYAGHRRLLDLDEEDEGPVRFSAADRTLLGGGGDDEDEDDEEEDKDKDKDKCHGMFKKYTSQDYFKTPEPEKLKKLKKGSTLTPNVVVAQDGSGDFKTIKQALDGYPSNHKGRYFIYVKAGTYKEGQIVVKKNQCNVYMYGDGRDKTIITGDKSQEKGQTGATQTATFVAEGERFMARGIGFRNTAGPEGNQAVAFRSQAPNTIMVDCSFEGYQNTIYYHAHDQFYKNCSIYGTVDFITGSGRAFFQDCEIYIRKPENGQSCYITADGKMKHVEAAGVVLQKCKIKADKELDPVKGETKSYLGRPWKPDATAVVMQCNIGDLIQPQGWSTWLETKNHKTCMFREFYNKGPGSDTDDRVKWKGFKVIKDKKYAGYFTPDPFMDAKSWVRNGGIPVKAGFKY